jgi:hypothetical protein
MYRNIKKQFNSRLGPDYRSPGRIIEAQAELYRSWAGTLQAGRDMRLTWLGRHACSPAGPAWLLPGWAGMCSPARPHARARVGWPPQHPGGPAAGSPWLGQYSQPDRAPQATHAPRRARPPPLIPAGLLLPPGWPSPAPPAGRHPFRPGRDTPRPDYLPRKCLS